MSRFYGSLCTVNQNGSLCTVNQKSSQIQTVTLASMRLHLWYIHH